MYKRPGIHLVYKHYSKKGMSWLEMEEGDSTLDYLNKVQFEISCVRFNMFQNI